MAYSSHRHLVKPDGPTIWMRPADGLRQSLLSRGGWTLNCRAYGLLLHLFGTWYWAMSIDDLH
jgi:hypothetical protein